MDWFREENLDIIVLGVLAFSLLVLAVVIVGGSKEK